MKYAVDYGRRLPWTRVALGGIAGVTALLVGLTAAHGEPWTLMAFGLVCTALLAVVAVRHPWAPYCLTAVVMSLVLYVYAGPQLRIGSVGIWMTEAVFVAAAVASFVTGAGRRGRVDGPIGAIEVGMLIVVLGVLSGFVVAVAAGLSALSAVQDARNAVFFAAFWPAMAAFSSAQGRSVVLRVGAVMAVVTVALQVAQVAAGPARHVFVTGTYANLVGIEAQTGAIRVRPPGLTLVYIVAAFATCYLLSGPRRHRLMAGCLLATCVGGLLISQNRNMLIGLLFGVVAASVLSVRSSRAIMATFVAASVVVAIVGLAPMIGAAPTSTEGRLAMRVTSVANLQAVNATSLTDRTYENRLAWQALKTSPVFGIGWGTSYGATYQGTTRNWIHNGYLWFWLRLGIVPAVAFIVALLAAVRIGVLWQRHGESETSWLGSGIIAALLAMMVSALVGSYFSEPNSIVFLMGLLAFAASLEPVLRRLRRAALLPSTELPSERPFA